MTSSGTGHLGRGLVFSRSGSSTGCILYPTLQPCSGHASLRDARHPNGQQGASGLNGSEVEPVTFARQDRLLTSGVCCIP